MFENYMNSPASTQYNSNSGSSNTVSNRSSASSSNSNKNEISKSIRAERRARFQREGQPESWWNPRWYYLNQVRRRKKRAENVVKYTSERPVSRQRVSLRNITKRELTGRLVAKYKAGNVVVQIRRANGRKEYIPLGEFNSRYGEKWKSMGFASSRLISPTSNIQRRNIKVIKFVNRNK